MSSMPPPPPSAAPQKGSNVWIWVIVALVGLCIICAIGAFLLFRGGMGIARGFVGCFMSYELAYESMRAYAEEHDGNLPPAETWQDDISVYYDRLRSKAESEMERQGAGMFFDAPSASDEWDCSFQGRTTTVTYNSALAGQSFEEAEEDAVLLFEGPNAGRNAHLDYDSLDSGSRVSVFGEGGDAIEITIDNQWEGSAEMDNDLDIDYRDALEENQ